jgi:hypothetical protein
MQKLSGTSTGKNNKICVIFHHESNEIEFAFFWFFYDFLRNLQDFAKWLYYLRFTLARRSLESFRFLQICPYFVAEPLEIIGAYVALGGRPMRLRPNSGQPAAGVSRGRARGGAGVPYARFGKLDRAERWPTTMNGGTWRRLPLERPLRWVGRRRLRARTPRSSREALERAC